MERNWRILADRHKQRIPFPSGSYDFRSVLAVKGSLRRATRTLDGSGPIGSTPHW